MCLYWHKICGLRVRVNPCVNMAGWCLNELLGKLSSYNLLNYLIPGALFVAFGRLITRFDLLQPDTILALCTYYFYGMVLSRIGSLFIEPILKRYNIIELAPYESYVQAAAVDSKIAELSEQNNMYRTMAALFLGLIVLKLVEAACDYWGVGVAALLSGVLPLLLLLFLISFKKQTKYISKRVGVHTDVSNN